MKRCRIFFVSLASNALAVWTCRKAVTNCWRNDINTNDNLQLCFAIRSGCEITVHASVNILED